MLKQIAECSVEQDTIQRTSLRRIVVLDEKCQSKIFHSTLKKQTSTHVGTKQSLA